MGARRSAWGAGLAAVAALSACVAPIPTPPGRPAPDTLVTAAPVPQLRPVRRIKTGGPADSADLQRHYARVEAGLLARGLLRTDGGGPDTPFSATTLARNFLQIAMYDEYDLRSASLTAKARESRLRRWEHPIRMAVGFGDGVANDRRTRDRNAVAAYGNRLSRLTGVPVTQTTEAAANFHVLFLDETDRRAAAPRLRALVPDLSPTLERALIELDRDTYCAVLAFSNSEDGAYSRAIAIIRDEHRGVLRTSCLHEELAQGMGLANDSPRARPSIFNDDEEFAFLTTHDELLLKMLYDDRLRSGMTLEQVAPIAKIIAAELMTPES